MGRPGKKRVDVPEPFRSAVLDAFERRGSGAAMAAAWAIATANVTRRKQDMVAGMAPLQHWIDVARELGVPVPPEVEHGGLDDLDREALAYAATARRLDDELRATAIEALRASRAILEERIERERQARAALEDARRDTVAAAGLVAGGSRTRPDPGDAQKQ